MCLQHSRSAAVIAIAGRVHAMIGTANSSSDSNETPSLRTGFIPLRKYRFDHRLHAIPPEKLQVTDGRVGLAHSNPLLFLRTSPRFESYCSRGINGLLRFTKKKLRSQSSSVALESTDGFWMYCRLYLPLWTSAGGEKY